MRPVHELIRGGVVMAVLFDVLLAGACRPTAVVVTPPAPTPAAPRTPNIKGPWDVELGQAVSYEIYVDVSMMSRYTDSISYGEQKFDTSSVAATVLWSSRTANRWDGKITQFAAGGQGGPRVSVTGVRFPVTLSYAARDLDGPWMRSSPPESACSVESAVAAIGREVVVPVPVRLRRDAVWHDSSTVTTCRDSIPLEVTSVRRYRVVEAVAVGDEVHLRIERTTTTRFQGTGRQLGEPVTLIGSGTGTMRFTLARTDGFIVMGEGEQTLDLRLQGRRRTQEVRQTTRINVQRAR